MLRNMKSSKHFQIMRMPMLLHLHFGREFVRGNDVIKSILKQKNEISFLF